MTTVGLQWVQATDVYTRLEASAGMSIPQTVALCNTIKPWMYMQRCNVLDSGVVAAVYGDRCYTDTDVATMGQCMVYVPKFWYYTDHTTSPGTYNWWISDTGTDTINGSAVTWKVHPAFIRNGITKEYLLFGAYEGFINDINGTLQLESKAGVRPSGDLDTVLLTGSPHATLDNFRSWAHNRAGGVANKWETADFLLRSAVKLLYLIEYGTFNCQLTIGNGISSLVSGTVNESCYTGHTSTLGNVSGSGPTFVSEPPQAVAVAAVAYRGIENLWGNMGEWVDGINIKAARMPWIADHNFASATFASPYVDTGFTMPTMTSATFIGDIANAATNIMWDWTFFPSASGGSTSTKLCDYGYSQETNSQLYYEGGWWQGSAGNGLFRYQATGSSTTYSRLMAGRLMFIP